MGSVGCPTPFFLQCNVRTIVIQRYEPRVHRNKYTPTLATGQKKKNNDQKQIATIKSTTGPTSSGIRIMTRSQPGTGPKTKPLQDR